MDYSYTDMVFQISCRASSITSIPSMVITTFEKSPLKYFCGVTKSVNERKDEHEIQTRKLRTGLVKLSNLSNNFAIHSGPGIDWIIFHDIAIIYRDMKHQETLQASLKTKNLKAPECSSPPHPYQPSELNLPRNLQEVPPNLRYIKDLP